MKLQDDSNPTKIESVKSDSDTGSVTVRDLEPTKFSNLKRSTRTGKYFAHAHVCGRLVRRSLGTASIEIAKHKLDELLSQERQRLAKSPDDGLTFAALLDQHERETVDGWAGKPSGLHYREECVKALRDRFPDLLASTVAQAVERLPGWLDTLRGLYSPTRYNGILSVINACFRIAVKRGLLLVPPETKRAPVRVMQKDVPEREQFSRLLEWLDSDRKRKSAALSVRLMAYTGCRVGCLTAFRAENFSLQRNEVVLPSLKYDDPGRPVRVPMICEMRSLAEEIAKKCKPGEQVVKARSPRNALITACVALKIPRVTPHTLRHLFATRAIESGVDVRTVAAWLGHKDGGALLLRRYAHLRNDHSQAMAKKVKF